MKNRYIPRLGAVRKMVLALVGCATFAIPLAIGSLTSPYGTVQAATAEASAPALRNVVVTLGPPPFTPLLPQRDLFWLGLVGESGAQLQFAYTSLRGFVASAYGVHSSQVVGKDMSKEPQYTITADNPWAEKPTDSGDERAARFTVFNKEFPAVQRHLLATQFGLVVKQERRQMAGYVLTVSPGGSKLRPDTDASFIDQGTGQSDRELIATMVPLSTIVHLLEDMFYAPVVDQTGLNGTYDYKLVWAPAPAGTTPDPATMAKALEELGLHLEARPVTVEVINVVSLKSPEQVLTSK